MESAEGQSLPVEKKSSGEVEAKIRQLIDAEAMGSATSMAFCDFVDHSLAQRDKSETGQLRQVVIGEAIRQRVNEVPGYMGAYNAVRGLHKELNSAVNEERKAARLAYPVSTDVLGDDKSVYAPSYDRLDEIKAEYLMRKSYEITQSPAPEIPPTPPEANNPPTPPAPSV
jgi:hypothetical protein